MIDKTRATEDGRRALVAIARNSDVLHAKVRLVQQPLGAKHARRRHHAHGDQPLGEPADPTTGRPSGTSRRHLVAAGAFAGGGVTTHGVIPKPTKRFSLTSSTPDSSKTRDRTRFIREYTSTARPPGSAWMKLACFSLTTALPRRSPLHPAASISRAA